MSARNEDRILSPDSSRQKVEKYLGKAVVEEAIAPQVLLKEFRFPERAKISNSRFVNHLIFYAPGYTPNADVLQVVATYCRYEAKGKIVPHGIAGETNAMALMTLGLTEIICIPMAIGEVSPDSTVENHFDVWYSTKGKVLAYYWTWTSSADRKEESRETVKPADVTRAPSVGQ